MLVALEVIFCFLWRADMSKYWRNWGGASCTPQLPGIGWSMAGNWPLAPPLTPCTCRASASSCLATGLLHPPRMAGNAGRCLVNAWQLGGASCTPHFRQYNRLMAGNWGVRLAPPVSAELGALTGQWLVTGGVARSTGGLHAALAGYTQGVAHSTGGLHTRVTI